VIYQLKKPIVFDGKTITELALDFDQLTGQDLLDASKEMALAQGMDVAVVAALDQQYQAAVAAKAAGVPVDLIVQLKGADFIAVCMEAQAFLLGSDAEPMP
jgi:hypothetical protein